MGGNGAYSFFNGGVLSNKRTHTDTFFRIGGHKVLLQKKQPKQRRTLAGFTRSASRRMDAELCLLQLCQPELNLDLKALNARLSRLEDTVKSGAFAVAPSGAKLEPSDCAGSTPPEAEPAPLSVEAPAPLEESIDEVPMGFWSDVLAAARGELPRHYTGLFGTSDTSSVTGVVSGERLELRCTNTWTAQAIDREELLEVMARKASSLLGRPLRAVVVDLNASPEADSPMEQLLRFGRENPDIVTIKNNGQ